MAQYTTPHSLPVIEPAVDNIKQAADPSKLAKDINALATATNAAISAEGGRAESTAKAAAASDATNKANAAKAAAVEEAKTKAAQQDGRLDNHEIRVKAIEVLGGLAPGDVSDATITDLLANRETTARAVVDAAIDAKAVVVNAYDHGAVADGANNDYWRIQAALNAAKGKDVVLEGGKTYLIAGTLSVPAGQDSVSLRATGSKPAILKLGADGQSYPAIKFEQPVAAATTTLAARVSHGAIGWPVVNAAGVQPGMLCEVKSSASWYFDPRPESSDARKSELHRVRRVEGNTVYFDDPANDGYDTSTETVTLTFRKPIKVRLENIIAVGTLPAVATETKATIGIEVHHADAPELINVSAENCARTGVRTFLSYRPRIMGGYTARANNFYNGYGVSVDGCAHALVKDRLTIECRRSTDVTGQNIISRVSTLENCTAIGGGKNSRGENYGWNPDGSLGADQYGFGTHGPADQTEYINCKTIGIMRPYSLRGRDERLINPRHVGPTHGGVVQLGYGTNFFLKGGEVTAGWWGYKNISTYTGASVPERRPDCLVRIYSNYQTNPPTGTTRGRIVISGVVAEVRDTFVHMESLPTAFLPLGHFAIVNNDVHFWPVDATATARLLFYSGTDSGSNKSKWFIGPNRLSRDSGTGSVVTATNINLTGANVINYTTAA